MKPSPIRSRSIRRHVLATAVACCFAPVFAWGNPVGPVVTSGQASFSTQGKTLTITNTSGSIINWQGFSIGAGETTRFVQQGAASTVLNRVVGGQSSSILGTLASNGRVFLVNPNGIMFGAGAVIDTAGLVASTLNMLDSDFLTGKMRFGATPDAKSIVNAGEIRTPAGGRVMLIAPEGVTNSGIINTPKGEVMLAAGKTVEITDTANPEVRVELTAPAGQAINLGRIMAESGKVGIYGTVVANRGTVNANSAVVGENGRIVFRASKDATLDAGSTTMANGPTGGSIEVGAGGTTLMAGDVQAKGNAGTGGEVKLLGEQVGVIGSARVDASGDLGGGTVLVGGDLQGANPSVQNARRTYVGPDASIVANAGTSGNGGKVIVWADEVTRSHGSISARGGEQSGNGGLVETSGKQYLDVTRGPDVRAPAGQGGTWLIDPNDLTIVDGKEQPVNNTSFPFFAPTGESSVIGNQLINAQLDTGSNVTLTTGDFGAVAGTQQGNITINAPIVKTAESSATTTIGSTTLTLRAHNNVVIGAGGSISSTGDPLNVTLRGNSDNVGGGGITIGGSITTNGGSVNASSTDAINITAPINTIRTISGSGGSVQLASSAGAVNVGGAVTSGFFSASGQTGVSVTAPINAVFSSINASSAAGPVTIGANLSATHGINLTARTGVKITNGAQVSAGTSSYLSSSVTDPAGTASFDVDAGSTVTAYGIDISSDNMEILGTMTANSGGMSLSTYNGGRATDLGTNTSGKLSLTQAELNRLSAPYLDVFSSGPVTISAPLTLPFANNTYISTNSTLTSTGGASITSTGSLSLFSSGAMTLGGAISGPSVEINSSNGITQSAGATIASTGDLYMSAPSISLGAATNADSITLQSNTMTVGTGVTSAHDISLYTYGFVPINLGVTTKGAGSLDLTATELNRFTTGANNALRVGSTGSGLLTVQGPIAPTGSQTLYLSSGSGIGQAAGGTIMVPFLGIQTYGNVTLPEANAVGTLAADLYSSSAAFGYTSAAGTALTVGDVPSLGMSGINLFGSNASVNLSVNQLNVASWIDAGSNGSVTIKPISPGIKVDLGGADAAGTTLGLDANDVANIYGAKLIVKADKIDISAPVAPSTSALALAPLTQAAGPAPRGLAIVSAKTGGSDLELTNADINNVSVGQLVIGDASTGRIDIQSQVSAPSSIGTLTFNTGDQATGIAVNAPVAATNSLAFIADTLALNSPASSSGGSITIAPNTASRPMEIGGRSVGKLGLSSTEVTTMLSAPNGTLTFGSSTTGNIDVLTPLNLTSINPPAFNDLSLISSGIITTAANADVLAPGNVSLTAPQITLNAAVRSTDYGNVTLVADRMALGGIVEAQNASDAAGAGVIYVQPRTPRLVTIGADDTVSSLGLTMAEVGNLEARSMVRIGDSVNTRSIAINATDPQNPTAVLRIAPAAPTLSLVAGPSNVTNSITQSGQGVLAVENLAATARNNISLDLQNDVLNVAATSPFGTVSITRAPTTLFSASPVLTVANVDGLSGIRTNSGDISLRADQITLADPVVAGFGSRNVTIKPFTTGQSITLGTKPGNTLGLDNAELNKIAASTLTLGDTSTTGNVTVTAPVSITGGPDGIVSNISIATQTGQSTAIDNPFSVPGSIGITTGSLAVNAAVTSQFDSIAATADAMTFAQPVSATSGNITLQSRTAGLQIAVGGADAVGTVLGLDATDLGHLSYGNTLQIGSNSAGNMGVSYAGSALPNNVSLSTGGTMAFSSAFGAAGKLSLTANAMSIPSGASIAGGTGVAISTATAGRNVVLGTKPGGAALELDAAELGSRIMTGTGGTLTIDTTGTMTTTAPVTFSTDLVNHVALQAGTFDNTAGTLTLMAPSLPPGPTGTIALRADSMTIASDVTNSTGGRITVTPRPPAANPTRGMVLGSNTGTSLNLDATEIAHMKTSGTVQFGDTGTTTSLSVQGTITQPAGSGALMLSSQNSISQSAGATITASNLRLQSSSSITLTEANNVGTLSGTSNGSFSFSNGIPLTIGLSDGVDGIQDSSVTLRANEINIAGPISASSVSLAPLTGGTNVTLGTKTAGQFTLSDAELDRISASTVAIGTAAAPNPTGNITVDGAIDGSGSYSNLNLVTGAGRTIAVNAALGSSSNNTIALNAGSGGTASITAPIHASSSISVAADTISTTGAITSDFGNVTLSNPTSAGTIAVGGAVDAYFGVSMFGHNVTLNAPVTARYPFSTITLNGSGAGSSLTINQPVHAGSTINIATDQIAINAALITDNSTVSLRPLTSGTPISLGTETAGAFSLTTSELGLITVDNLTIGTTSSGPIAITAPIGSTGLNSLSLQSNGSIIQSPGATITVGSASAGQPGTLSVFSSTGSIVLNQADNQVASSISGNAGSTSGVFLVKNANFIKLQNLSSSISPAVTPAAATAAGIVLPSTTDGGLTVIAPPDKFSFGISKPDDPVDAVLNDVLKASSGSSETKAEAEEKTEQDRAQREDNKKKGKKSCS